MHFPTAVPLLLAALLLSPVAAPAQAPSPAKTPAQQVTIQVTFVTVKTEDLDALGVNFDLIPLSASPRTFLACVEGNVVPQMYQTLTRTAVRIGSHTISLAPMTVSDNAPAVFTVNTQVPNVTASATMDGKLSGFPQLTAFGQLRGKITLIPQTVPGNLVTLDMLSPVDSNRRMRFRTVPSGQQVVVYVGVVPAQVVTSGRRKILDTTELMIFITPTIASKTVMPAPMVKPRTTAQPKPQAQFSGSAAGFSSSSFGFGTGFGLGRPSDVLPDTHWLESLHWSGGSKIRDGSRINGTISEPSLAIEASKTNGVKRIYAL